MKIIELKNVSKIIKDHVLIDDISLSIEKGQAAGFVGRNGSGKTVLLKLISGIYTVTNGIVLVDGKIIGKDMDFPEDVGIIIEHPGFLPALSGRGNLKLLAQINKKADSKRVKQAMEFVGLDYSNRKAVGKYSLGMKQRLGLAQAIMEQPKILILDEPFNGLDQIGVQEMRQHLLKLKKEGITLLIATHSQDDIEQLCDVVYMLEDGKIINT